MRDNITISHHTITRTRPRELRDLQNAPRKKSGTSWTGGAGGCLYGGVSHSAALQGRFSGKPLSGAGERRDFSLMEMIAPAVGCFHTTNIMSGVEHEKNYCFNFYYT